MTSKLRRKYVQGGFTLLELLISLALLGLLLVLLFGGLRLGLRSWDSVQRQVDILNSVRSIERFLRSELEQIRPYRWKRQPSQGMAFAGGRNRVQFVAPLVSRAGLGGLYMLSISFESTHEARQLLLRYQSIGDSSDSFSLLESVPGVPLAKSELDSVDEIVFSYFGEIRAGEGAHWWGEWASDAGLPQLIRMEVRSIDGTVWKEFVVAPMIATAV